MSITIDGYSPVYHPTPAPSGPKHDDNQADALAALNDAIAAAKRALEAARKAQEAADKARKALDENKDASQKAALQGDYDTKKATADEKWADLKVLEPLRDFKARHASILLTFDAVVDALDRLEGRT